MPLWVNSPRSPPGTINLSLSPRQFTLHHTPPTPHPPNTYIPEAALYKFLKILVLLNAPGKNIYKTFHFLFLCSHKYPPFLPTGGNISYNRLQK